MFYQVKQKLKELIEAELGPGGRLEGIQKVYLGSYKLMASNLFPNISIMFTDGTQQGVLPNFKLQYDYFIYVRTIAITDDEAEKALEPFIDDYSGAIHKGIIPVLNNNSGIIVDTIPLRIIVNPWLVNSGEEVEAGRISAEAKIPITIQTRIRHS